MASSWTFFLNSASTTLNQVRHKNKKNSDGNQIASPKQVWQIGCWSCPCKALRAIGAQLPLALQGFPTSGWHHCALEAATDHTTRRKSCSPAFALPALPQPRGQSKLSLFCWKIRLWKQAASSGGSYGGLKLWSVSAESLRYLPGAPLGWQAWISSYSHKKEPLLLDKPNY